MMSIRLRQINPCSKGSRWCFALRPRLVAMKLYLVVECTRIPDLCILWRSSSNRFESRSLLLGWQNSHAMLSTKRALVVRCADCSFSTALNEHLCKRKKINLKKLAKNFKYITFCLMSSQEIDAIWINDTICSCQIDSFNRKWRCDDKVAQHTWNAVRNAQKSKIFE